MQNTNLFILYISAFGIIAGGITVYFISKKFTKPIEDINRVAIHVSNLDFTSRAMINTRKDEIGSLASNINLMSDRLEENIQNLKEANRKLEIDNEFMNRVDEQRKELIANISHELKTPLAILSGYSEMLKTDVPGIDKAFYYDTIQDETRKMNILIQNLLDLSNMENKLTELSLDEINPVEFVDRIIKKYSIIFQNKGIGYEFEADTCGIISADTLYLEEAINNYLSNAVSHTKKGHLIRIRVAQRGDEAVISVFNEGDNIDEAQIEKIWNSFYRVDKSRTRTSQNNIGLGLYIVRSVMNAHHGRCGVTNRENGVEFWLSLKVVQ
jgi:signal transduction histidine kinase